MRFSILLPTKDRPQWVGRAIESVLAQSFSDWELVIYNNGASHTLLPSGDRRIHYVRGPAEGPADAFQRALELAQGEIIHPLGDDDQLPPDALEVVDREILIATGKAGSSK